ncbi:hypothetical protein FIBSPDRAFT_923692 [Athelia psychrophila]|uniref:Uncharacterized protein n=1 Tax=Athelia psychrophila TaxID=1759441 RepID=A0A166WUK5_9AGAM|nr:hypothetical protein FIBSPDRAFT_923692 [Fibularhizoctonia sp. CBS 109695]
MSRDIDMANEEKVSELESPVEEIRVKARRTVSRTFHRTVAMVVSAVIGLSLVWASASLHLPPDCRTLPNSAAGQFTGLPDFSPDFFNRTFQFRHVLRMRGAVGERGSGAYTSEIA